MTNLKSTISNIILADVTENFQFYMYSVDCTDSKGNIIDSCSFRRWAQLRDVISEKNERTSAMEVPASANAGSAAAGG